MPATEFSSHTNPTGVQNGDERPGLRSRPKNLAQHVVDEIIGRVHDKTLQIGDKLPTEATLMREFGVSRTVIREALSRLQANGIVETRHGIGTFILQTDNLQSVFSQGAPTTIRDIIAMLEIRIGVEAEAVALAALRATPKQIAGLHKSLNLFDRQIRQGQLTLDADVDFHLGIARATNNKYFEEMSGFFNEVIPRARINTYRFSTGIREKFLRRMLWEHQTILAAIENRNPSLAQSIMRVHLNNSLDLLNKAQEDRNARNSGRFALEQGN